MKPYKLFILVLSMLMLLLCSCDGFIANPSISEHSPGTPNKATPNRFSDYDKFPLPYETELKVSSDGGQLILSKQQALEDYDALWEILEDNYPYFETIKNELGLDWREVKDTYRTELISVCTGPSILQDNYINVINNCLNQFESIGHLYIIQPFLYQYMVDVFRSVVESSGGNQNPDSKEEADTMADMLSRTLSIIESQKVKTFYDYYENLIPSPTPASTEGSTQLYPQEQLLYEEVRQTIIEDTVGDGIPYIKITGFTWSSSECTPIAIKMIQDYFEANSEADEIIIDIQGNGGGNDVVWMDGIISHISCEPLIQYGMIGVKDGKFNRFMWDAEQPFSSELQEIDSETWNKTFPDLNMEDFAYLKFYSNETTYTPHEDSICFQGQLWMLIDSSNYSASDAFASFCKATGFARLVGETTGGNGRGGQPYTFALPNSGLLVYFDPYFSLNPDGSCNAIAGTRPDIETKAGMTALETCLEAIGRDKD